MSDSDAKIKILVVDDDEDFREFVTELLKQAGYATLIAGNVAEGLAQYRFRHPDLVLTDLVMPGQEGSELIFSIREKEPERPIIAMSGGYRNAGRNLEMADTLGADAILNKPFASAELLETISRLVEERLGK